MGTLAVLNVGAGDMRFSFNSDDPLEVARASRVVKDMLARGYMLFVEVEGKLKRVKRFDEAHCTYIVADGPEAQPAKAAPTEEVAAPEPDRRKWGQQKRRKEERERAVSAKTHRATGVAPTAGG